MGPTRSTRLPAALDTWFEDRLALDHHLSASDLLVSLIHGGLRLREGYMPIHRRALEHYAASGLWEYQQVYLRCLLDTFGADYVEHLERWLEADGIAREPQNVRA